MRKKLLSVVLSFALLIGADFCSAASSGDSFAPGGKGFAELANRLLPAVVNISTEQTVDAGDSENGMSGGGMFRFPGLPFPKGMIEEFFNMDPFFSEQAPKPRKVVSLGSGFIVDKSGLIVTNYHVIANAKEIQVKFSDNSTAKASVVGKDLKTDLAVLKVAAKKELPCVAFGDSDSVMVGEWVLAIGNPFGLGGSVSVGIVSGRARDINIGTTSEFLQTDAAINRGHSGGPLFNADGEVIGINTAIISPQGGGNVGVAFAIPSNNAARIVKVLSKGEKIEHGWLGIVVQNVTEEMISTLGLEEARGALISSVAKGSPAEKSGLKVGDVVLEFNGVKITEVPKFTNLIAKSPVNSKAKVIVQRDGREVSLTVTIGKFSDEESLADGKSEIGEDVLGITVGNMPKDAAKSEEKGVVVLKVNPGSEAFAAGIRRGDIILGINSSVVDSVAAFSKELTKAKNSKKDSVLLLLKKSDASPSIYVPLSINKKGT